MSEASTPEPERRPAPAPDGETQPGGQPRKRRRRGSRGGRSRAAGSGGAGGQQAQDGGAQSGGTRQPNTASEGAPRAEQAQADQAPTQQAQQAQQAQGVDRRPDDLPDRPIEGVPSPEAAERAEVRPKVGDTRPAPPFIPKVPPPRAQAQDDAAKPPAAAGQQAAASANGGSGDQQGQDGGSKRRRRRGGRGRSGGGPKVVTQSVSGEAVELDAETLERRRGRERKGRPVGRYLMCVHVRPQATQIAVLEGRALIEHYVSRPQDDATQIDGNIYLGRVQNVLPGMEAAFIDIGTPKNAVLYRGDVRYDKDDVEGGKKSDVRIEQVLRSGQTILCQVTKNPIGTKGARLTQEVSLPGRFCVLIPNSDTYGISKRLTDDERKRLRKVLDEVKPAQHGIIVRTAAEGATSDELRRDVQRLVRQWEDIDALAKRSKAPALLYREPDMAVRVIREEFNKEYRGVVIDDRRLYEEVRDYVASISPELADRVEFYDKNDDPLPIFERFHIHEQLHKALDRKVWLPSGGSLIIERTEALTVIDVNTGKNVGTSSLEETVYRNNLEAAEEIARQLRLRDIGGIIVIDFIDMEVASNRADVIRAFRDALARDKTRTQVFDISELGLVEMTRKRISEGLVESLSETCPTCNGRGLLLDDSLL